MINATAPLPLPPPTLPPGANIGGSIAATPVKSIPLAAAAPAVAVSAAVPATATTPAMASFQESATIAAPGGKGAGMGDGSTSNKNGKRRTQIIFASIAALVVAAGLGIGLVLSQQNADLRQRAANTTPQCNTGSSCISGSVCPNGGTKTGTCSIDDVSGTCCALNNAPGGQAGPENTTTYGCDNNVPINGTACKSQGDQVQWRCLPGSQPGKNIWIFENCNGGTCQGNKCSIPPITTGAQCTNSGGTCKLACNGSSEVKLGVCETGFSCCKSNQASPSYPPSNPQPTTPPPATNPGTGGGSNSSGSTPTGGTTSGTSGGTSGGSTNSTHTTPTEEHSTELNPIYHPDSSPTASGHTSPVPATSPTATGSSAPVSSSTVTSETGSASTTSLTAMLESSSASPTPTTDVSRSTTPTSDSALPVSGHTETTIAVLLGGVSLMLGGYYHWRRASNMV